MYRTPFHERLIINIDANLYSSTIYVLRTLKNLMKPGTLLYFDEFNHVQHEPRAFEEFTLESKLQFKTLYADKTLAHVCFECVDGAPTART